MRITARRIAGVTAPEQKQNKMKLAGIWRPKADSLAESVFQSCMEMSVFPYPPAAMVLLLLEQREAAGHALSAAKLLTVLNRMEVTEIQNITLRQTIYQLYQQISYELGLAQNLNGTELQQLRHIYLELRNREMQRRETETARAEGNFAAAEAVRSLDFTAELQELRTRLIEKSGKLIGTDSRRKVFRDIRTVTVPLPDHREIWRQSVKVCGPARTFLRAVEALQPEQQAELLQLLGERKDVLLKRLYVMRPAEWRQFAARAAVRLRYAENLQEEKQFRQLEAAQLQRKNLRAEAEEAGADRKHGEAELYHREPDHLLRAETSEESLAAARLLQETTAENRRSGQMPAKVREIAAEQRQKSSEFSAPDEETETVPQAVFEERLWPGEALRVFAKQAAQFVQETEQNETVLDGRESLHRQQDGKQEEKRPAEQTAQELKQGGSLPEEARTATRRPKEGRPEDTVQTAESSSAAGTFERRFKERSKLPQPFLNNSPKGAEVWLRSMEAPVWDRFAIWLLKHKDDGVLAGRFAERFSQAGETPAYSAYPELSAEERRNSREWLCGLIAESGCAAAEQFAETLAAARVFLTSTQLETAEQTIRTMDEADWQSVSACMLHRTATERAGVGGHIGEYLQEKSAGPVTLDADMQGKAAERPGAEGSARENAAGRNTSDQRVRENAAGRSSSDQSAQENAVGRSASVQLVQKNAAGRNAVDRGGGRMETEPQFFSRTVLLEQLEQVRIERAQAEKLTANSWGRLSAEHPEVPAGSRKIAETGEHALAARQIAAAEEYIPENRQTAEAGAYAAGGRQTEAGAYIPGRLQPQEMETARPPENQLDSGAESQLFRGFVRLLAESDAAERSGAETTVLQQEDVQAEELAEYISYLEPAEWDGLVERIYWNRGSEPVSHRFAEQVFFRRETKEQNAGTSVRSGQNRAGKIKETEEAEETGAIKEVKERKEAQGNKGNEGDFRKDAAAEQPAEADILQVPERGKRELTLTGYLQLPQQERLSYKTELLRLIGEMQAEAAANGRLRRKSSAALPAGSRVFQNVSKAGTDAEEAGAQTGTAVEQQPMRDQQTIGELPQAEKLLAPKSAGSEAEAGSLFRGFASLLAENDAAEQSGTETAGLQREDVQAEELAEYISYLEPAEWDGLVARIYRNHGSEPLSRRFAERVFFRRETEGQSAETGRLRGQSRAEKTREAEETEKTKGIKETKAVQEKKKNGGDFRRDAAAAEQPAEAGMLQAPERELTLTGYLQLPQQERLSYKTELLRLIGEMQAEAAANGSLRRRSSAVLSFGSRVFQNVSKAGTDAEEAGVQAAAAAEQQPIGELPQAEKLLAPKSTGSGTGSIFRMSAQLPGQRQEAGRQNEQQNTKQQNIKQQNIKQQNTALQDMETESGRAEMGSRTGTANRTAGQQDTDVSFQTAEKTHVRLPRQVISALRQLAEQPAGSGRVVNAGSGRYGSSMQTAEKNVQILRDNAKQEALRRDLAEPEPKFALQDSAERNVRKQKRQAEKFKLGGEGALKTPAQRIVRKTAPQGLENRHENEDFAERTAGRPVEGNDTAPAEPEYMRGNLLNRSTPAPWQRSAELQAGSEYTYGRNLHLAGLGAMAHGLQSSWRNGQKNISAMSTDMAEPAEFAYRTPDFVITRRQPPDPRTPQPVPETPDIVRQSAAAKTGENGDGEKDVRFVSKKPSFATAVKEYRQQVQKLRLQLSEQTEALEEMRKEQALLQKRTDLEQMTAQVLKRLQQQLRLEKMRRGL